MPWHDRTPGSPPVLGPLLGRAADSPFGGDLEAIALAVPTDALGGPLPPELTALTAGARASFDAVGARRWAAVASWVDAMAAAWKSAGGSGVPRLLAGQMTRALDTLIRAVAARDPARARQAAHQVEQALDLQLRHRPPAQVDLDRMGLWARQLLVDAAAKDRGAVASDAATLRIL
jgi:hypothetical protein